MSDRAIVLHDAQASTEDIGELFELMEKIVPKLDIAIGMDIHVDQIVGMSIIKGKDCEHRFFINDACTGIECIDCEKKYPVCVNKADHKTIAKMRLQKEESKNK